MDFNEPLKFETNIRAVAFRKKLANLIEKHIEVELSDKTMAGIYKLEDLVKMLASCPGRLPWQSGDGVQIDMTGIKKKPNFFKKAFLGFIASTPSDYFIVLNKIHSKN